MQHQISTTGKRGRSEQGFSIVEVLIAITVLIVGIVAVIELFPPGFLMLASADTRSRVQALATDEISRTSSALTQIELIYSQYSYLDDTTTFSQKWAAGLTTTGGPNGGYANGGPNSELIVSGEMATIPKLNTSGSTSQYSAWTPLGTGTCTYPLTYSPIWMPTTSSTLLIRGVNWTALSATSYTYTPSTGQPDVAPIGLYDPTDVLKPNQPQFEVDYANGRIALPLEYGYADYNAQVREGTACANRSISTNAIYTQTFTITVNVTSGSTPTTYTGTLTVAPSDIYYKLDAGCPAVPVDPTWHTLWFDPRSPALSGGGSTVSWVGGTAPPSPTPLGSPTVAWTSVTLRRDFQLKQITSSVPFDGDPYEYALDANIGGASQVYSGLIHLNPWASTLRDAANNSVALVADYYMADTHILCEDHAATSDSIRVDAPAILQLGDPLDQGDIPGATYAGMIDSRLSMGTGPDILMFDLDKGVELSSNSDYFVNYAAGRIQLGPSYATSNAHLRIFYRARHLWSARAIKAASSYNYAGVYAAGTNPASHTDPTQLAQYWVASSSAGNTRLYFPYCDIGKAVNLGTLTVTNTAGGTSAITGMGSWTILAPDSTATAAGAGNMGYIDLASGRVGDANPTGWVNASTQSVLPLSTGAGPLSSVTGGSVTERITYMENNSWRHQDVTTFINPTN